MTRVWAALFLAACATGGDSPTLAQRLQGDWFCHRVVADAGFMRTDEATLSVNRASIQYNWNRAWACDSAAPCPGTPPKTLGGYFEGIFSQVGDSLVLQDATDTVAFRDVGDSSFSFVIDGTAFPMRRR